MGLCLFQELKHVRGRDKPHDGAEHPANRRLFVGEDGSVTSHRNTTKYIRGPSLANDRCRRCRRCRCRRCLRSTERLEQFFFRKRKTTPYYSDVMMMPSSQSRRGLCTYLWLVIQSDKHEDEGSVRLLSVLAPAPAMSPVSSHSFVPLGGSGNLGSKSKPCFPPGGTPNLKQMERFSSDRIGASKPKSCFFSSGWIGASKKPGGKKSCGIGGNGPSMP